MKRILVGVSLLVMLMGCSSKQPENTLTPEQQDVKSKQELLFQQTTYLQNKIRVLELKAMEDGLKFDYLNGETGVLDKQVLEIIKTLDEYAGVGPQIASGFEVSPPIAWKLISARDKLVKEKLKELVRVRDVYRKDVKAVWKEYEENKRKAMEGN